MGKSRATKPTREQKRYITAANKDPKDYLVLDDMPESLRLVRKSDGTNRVIVK